MLESVLGYLSLYAAGAMITFPSIMKVEGKFIAPFASFSKKKSFVINILIVAALGWWLIPLAIMARIARLDRVWAAY